MKNQLPSDRCNRSKYGFGKMIEFGRTKNGHSAFIAILIGMIFILPKSGHVQSQKENDQTPNPRIMSFNPDSNLNQSIFKGEKDSVVFYSGVVTLFPDSSAELHNSEIYEEMIITLEGEGELRVPNKGIFPVKFGKIALVPPNTDHQMLNTGTKNLKYIYIATKAKK
jgi:mannose-6-phosphate isomerase-like protein (cupin superfamily)